jgi:hypothetical protein
LADPTDLRDEPTVLTASRAVRRDAPAGRARPLLSLVVIVEAEHLLLLEDLLVCLDAQSSPDFELRLGAAGLDEDELAGLASCVARFIELSRRTHIAVERAGDRVELLRRIALAAAGDLLTIVEPDALVFARFVEEIVALAGAHPGAVIRPVAAVQEVAPAPWPRRRDGYRAVAGPRPLVTEPFDAIAVLAGPYGPVAPFVVATSWLLSGGLAYLGEDPLDRLELFYRAGVDGGVVDATGGVTYLRRERPGADSGEVGPTALARFDAAPLVLPPNSASALVALLSATRAQQVEIAELRATRERLAADRVQLLGRIEAERTAHQRGLAQAGARRAGGENTPAPSPQLPAQPLAQPPVSAPIPTDVTGTGAPPAPRGAPSRRLTGALGRLARREPT